MKRNAALLITACACGSGVSVPPATPGPVARPFGRLAKLSLGMARAEVDRAAPGVGYHERDEHVADYTLRYDADRLAIIQIGVLDQPRSVIEKAWGPGLVPVWEADAERGARAYFDATLTTRAVVSTASPQLFLIELRPIRGLVAQIGPGLALQGTSSETEFGLLEVEDAGGANPRVKQHLAYRGGKEALFATLDKAWGTPTPDQIVDDVRNYTLGNGHIQVAVQDEVAILTVGP